MNQTVIAQLEAIVGARYVAPAADGNRIVVKPASTEQISQCLKILNEIEVPVVTLGGMTGLVRGTEMFDDAVAISTERLATIRSLDVSRKQLTVDAGVKLEDIQRYVADHRLRYGVDLGARGSCTIGGTIATNAGGTSVVRFGMTRANVVGLEVVLPNGAVLTNLGGLAKDNTGYDLKQVFIGSEGTLGIITQAVLKLTAANSDTASVLLALETMDNALDLMRSLQDRCGESLLALEIMWNRYFRAVSENVFKDGSGPMSRDYPIYILAQVEAGARSAEDIIAEAVDSMDTLLDSALASTNAQQSALWAVRDGSDFIEHRHAEVLSYDVSMRPQDYLAYIEEVEAALRQDLPGAIPYYFGHLADGNVHFMIGHDKNVDHAHKLVDRAVYEPLSRFWPSSISAEHGIGREKADHLWRCRSDAEIDTMNAIRRALDPKRILNPHIQFHKSPAA